MSLPHANSGDLINIAPLGDKFEGAVSHAFLKTDHLELMRLVLPAGKSMPEHWVEGEVTLQCLEGTFDLEAHGKRQVVRAGEMVYLGPRVPHALRAQENTSVLMTVLLNQPG
ncbi:MAG: cupin domain-containing protein [Oxalobacteraceae bacterium]|nr:MAG: cupin domain-containing protein [Oxalobacteraceae bacterium]